MVQVHPLSEKLDALAVSMTPARKHRSSRRPRKDSDGYANDEESDATEDESEDDLLSGSEREPSKREKRRNRHRNRSKDRNKNKNRLKPFHIKRNLYSNYSKRSPIIDSTFETVSTLGMTTGTMSSRFVFT